MPVLSLSLGSNIDAASNIRKAVAALRAEFDNLRCSTVYESEALGFSGDNFLNLVVVAETDKRLAAVLGAIGGVKIILGERDQRLPIDTALDIKPNVVVVFVEAAHARRPGE